MSAKRLKYRFGLWDARYPPHRGIDVLRSDAIGWTTDENPQKVAEQVYMNEESYAMIVTYVLSEQQ